MNRLVSAHDVIDAGPCRAGGDSSRSPTITPREKSVEKLIPLTVPEVRTLLVAFLFRRTLIPETVLAFSQWRRHHQLIAQRCHYRARGSPPKKVEL